MGKKLFYLLKWYYDLKFSKTFEVNVNRTNTVNFDTHWTSGAKKKGGFQISLAADL